MKLGWSHDLLRLDASAPALPQIERVDASDIEWVLIQRAAEGLAAARAEGTDDEDKDDEDEQLRPLMYVLKRSEFFKRLAQTRVPYRPGTRVSLEEVFRLDELMPSRVVQAGRRPRGIDALPDLEDQLAELMSGQRYVDLVSGSVATGEVAIGGPDVSPPRRTASARPSPSPTPATAGRPGGLAGPAPPRTAPPQAPPAEATAGASPDTPTDEGTLPLRYPSIEPETPPQAGEPVVLVVDLLREEPDGTLGAVALPELAQDWEELPIEVLLSCPHIVFDADGRGELRVRRNADSQPARIAGRVQAGLPAGQALQVKARFLLERRPCGSAARTLVLPGAAAAPSAAPPPMPPAVVQIDTAAIGPDLMVEISVADPDKPTRLAWSMSCAAFPGRPPRLNGFTQLGQAPGQEASALFARFAKLRRGEHSEAIEGFGRKLWDTAPAEFRTLYWAMCDHFQRPLTIQFVTDDAYMPWELMNPGRAGESHGPLALRHAVARWLLTYKGYLENRLPKGRLIAMAPRYGAGRELPDAEAATQKLVDALGALKAERIEGKRATLLKLLETPPREPVALLFFNGHGAFSSDTAGASLLKLEDGSEITPMEVDREEVKLGARDGTVVFLNACEVGATGSVLGNVGGWADAFLAREFRAFIAPLWAIDEEDGAQVTAELMDAIVVRQEPIGAALRDLRARHGAVSPTFYSYLLYGDVTARLGTA